MVVEALNEWEAQDRKMCNVVVFGLPEEETDRDEQTSMQKLMQYELHITTIEI